MEALPETIDGRPNICGAEKVIEEAIEKGARRSVFKDESPIHFDSVSSAFAIALHMHQPLIPAGGDDLRTAAVISNLKDMMDHQGTGDNHNAPVFLWCYKRMGEFIPQLLSEGKQPRVMLEYSGSLLHGLRDMGAHDVLDSLRRITCDPTLRQAVEWLGCPWGHAVAPSTPGPDYRLHVKAWQHHFAALFGLEALGRVRGFSPAEMAIPNHPDLAFEFVKTLRECGYRWVLAQEHTVELPDGRALERKHLPHLLVCVSSKGERASIPAIIKTQGSDTKLVAQMQPYYEAKGLSRWQLARKSVPPLVTQIADGENGGVMMNEFPGKYMEVMRECSWSSTPVLNVTEYLEFLYGLGIGEKDFPAVQPLFQKRIWDRMKPGDGPEKLAKTIEGLKKEDGRFHMEGGSWTSDISWVKGYGNVLGPMEEVSWVFRKAMLSEALPAADRRYREALFFLLNCQTSCYRYWGQGRWTDYGKEMCRRATEALEQDRGREVLSEAR